MMYRTAVAGALSLWIPTVCLAGHEPLTIGDKAPAVDIAHWLKGTPIKEFEPGKNFAGMYAAFARALDQGAPGDMPTGEDGLAATRIARDATNSIMRTRQSG